MACHLNDLANSKIKITITGATAIELSRIPNRMQSRIVSAKKLEILFSFIGSIALIITPINAMQVNTNAESVIIAGKTKNIGVVIVNIEEKNAVAGGKSFNKNL